MTVVRSALHLYWVWFLAAVFSAASSMAVPPEAPASIPPVQVSMVALLASPERFDQTRIVTIGFFRRGFEESCLYASEEAARNHVFLECLWLDLSGATLKPSAVKAAEEATRTHGGAYVIVDGTFDMTNRGHMGRSSVGGIGQITRLDPWPPQARR